MKLECGCVYDKEEKDCPHCDGSGEDYDMTGSGFCGYCSGKGVREVDVIEYMCDECSDKMSEIGF